MTRQVVVGVLLLVALWPVPGDAQAPPGPPPGGRGGPPPGGRGGPSPAGLPPSPRASAPIDLTGYWVSVVTEDWRYRMVTPTKGDYQGVPMTPEATKAADAWDPAADTAAGVQCKSYGAPAIMRVPGRIHVTWQDDTTLRVETDAGAQVRTFSFGTPKPKGEPSWQGDSSAQWEIAGRGRGRGGAAVQPPPGVPPAAATAAPPPPRFGSLKVVTTNLRPGYLRKNGVPYSENATLTEYFDLAPMRNGDQLLVVTTIVDDARYLNQPFVVSTQFKKQRDAAGWEPTPCSATW